MGHEPTVRTAWAAGLHDCEAVGYWPGYTRSGAIDAALSTIGDALDFGSLEPDEVTGRGLAVLRDVLWCQGVMHEDAEDCACGCEHDAADQWRVMRQASEQILALVVTPPAPDWGLDGYLVEVDEGTMRCSVCHCEIMVVDGRVSRHNVPGAFRGSAGRALTIPERCPGSGAPVADVATD